MLAIISARKGSKGLKNKNILNLNGKPLIAYSIEQALKSKNISRVIVSTDSIKIAKIARKYGAEVPFLRPRKLSLDNSSILKSFEHAINFYQKKGVFYKNFISLGTTCPLRNKDDIDNAIKKFFIKKALSLISVKKVDKPVEWYFKIKDNDRLEKYINKKIENRQKHINLLVPNGSIYVFNTANLLKNLRQNKDYFNNKTFYYLMPKNRSVDIDDIEDFKYAEHLIKK